MSDTVRSHLRNRHEMHPVVFNGCFGWLHLPEAGGTRDVAVLLCSGISQDHANGYRPFRLLADSLAEAGYPALRFDYPGIGDSNDMVRGNLWEVWLSGTMAAAEELRMQTGAARLVVCGLRIGAALAAVAAAHRTDIEALALIEPCLRGRPYASQLVTEARLRARGAANAAPRRPDKSDAIELGELMFDENSLTALRAIDVGKLTMPAGLSVAVFSRSAPEVTGERLRAWREAGVTVACQDIGNLEAMLQPSQHTDEPDADHTELLRWLASAAPHRRVSRAKRVPPERVALRANGWVERPLRFGRGRKLVGIVCEPDEAANPDLAVVIGNAGGNPRHGFARFSVELARRLAGTGIASLRMDFAGLGDSAHLLDGAEARTPVFEADRSRDVAAAVDILQARGYRRFAMHGLCSGAYHAVHAALAEPRIGAVLAVNLPWFSLRHDPPMPTSFARQCVDALSARGTGLTLIFGELDSGLKQFERHFPADGCDHDRFPGLSVVIIPGIDHELSLSWMRRAVAERLIRCLHQRGTQAAQDSDMAETMEA